MKDRLPAAVGYIQQHESAYRANIAWPGATPEPAWARPIVNNLMAGLAALAVVARVGDCLIDEPARVEITLKTTGGRTIVIRPRPEFGETEIDIPPVET